MTAAKRVLAVIPARMSSTRLPGKPLKDIGGKTLIERVWEQAKGCRSVSHLIVATDSPEIEEEVRGFGGEVLMTSSSLATGSERVAVASQVLPGPWDAVVNIQGDMPFIRSELVDQVVDFLLHSESRCDMATAATPIYSEEAFLSPANVKVVVSDRKEALYFSRAPIPFSRDGEHLSVPFASPAGSIVYGFKHFGLYVFRPEVLTVYQSSELSPLERIEKLEQLRLMEKGYRIGVCVVDPALTAKAVEVDTPEDLAEAERIARGK